MRASFATGATNSSQERPRRARCRAVALVAVRIAEVLAHLGDAG